MNLFCTPSFNEIGQPVWKLCIFSFLEPLCDIRTDVYWTMASVASRKGVTVGTSAYVG